jgi:uncharacterized RDD family membrane protein YckC
MSTAAPLFPSGSQGIGLGHELPSRTSARKAKRATALRKRSMLNLRGSAVILDGIVLVIPIVVVDYLLSHAFPHRGFFWSDRASGIRVGLGAPGALMATALVLSYFFAMEVTRGQTIGKRRYGLRVQSASGGPASVNAISARTVLRLIDQLPILYILGCLVAVVTGRQRRRIGDWVAGTVVVRDEEARLVPPPPSACVAPPPSSPPLAPSGATPSAEVNYFVPVQARPAGLPPMVGSIPPMAGAASQGPLSAVAATIGPPVAALQGATGVTAPLAQSNASRSSGSNWRVAGYPVLWVAAVLIGTFALGLGRAEGAGENAVALVRQYVQARQAGNAALACSLLTAGQQRELVAIQSGSYLSASASACPSYVLETESGSHLLNPDLPAFVAAGPTVVAASPTAAVVVSSGDPGLQLTAVTEDGRLKLDVRGLQEQEFVAGCAHAGLLVASECECAFDRLRAEGPIPENTQQMSASWRSAAQAAALQCRESAAAGTG